VSCGLRDNLPSTYIRGISEACFCSLLLLLLLLFGFQRRLGAHNAYEARGRVCAPHERVDRVRCSLGTTYGCLVSRAPRVARPRVAAARSEGEALARSCKRKRQVCASRSRTSSHIIAAAVWPLSAIHAFGSVLNASNACRGYSLCELPLPFCCRMSLCIAEYHGRARRVLVAERPARDERGE